MALFNLKQKWKRKTVNRAGGEAYRMDPQQELVSILLTSFAQDQFYRSAKKTYKELAVLLTKVSPAFAAKAAIFARREYGMRSITHVLAAELAPHASGKIWAKDFYTQIVKRPDDMLEIAAYYQAKEAKILPNAMKKGFAKAFDRFDGYQLAKYRGERSVIKLIDIVNLVHPVPTDKNSEALKALVEGTLRSRNTWESKLTTAGHRSDSAEQKAELKSQAWSELIRENKLGYFALLRNLRNIVLDALPLEPDLLPLLIKQLTDARKIKRSLVMPFRYLAAEDALRSLEISGKNGKCSKRFMMPWRLPWIMCRFLKEKPWLFWTIPVRWYGGIIGP